MSKLYIDIERSFHRKTDVSPPENFLGEYVPAPNWDWLLGKPCVVILARAGMGKTTECEERCKLLNTQGEDAWFVSVERLAEGQFIDALREEDSSKFQDWKNNKRGNKGFFFVDSVDEARLKRKKFEDALKSLEKAIGNENKNRACVIITCRSSDWITTDDLQLVKNYFCPPSQKKGRLADGGEVQTKKIDLEPCVVEMQPLSIEQAKYFAQQQEVENIEGLFEELEAKGFNFLMGRPMDIIPIISFWNRGDGNIPSYASILEESVDMALQEKTPDRRVASSLNRENLRLGAEKVSAALMFCHKDNILLPNNPISPKIEQKTLAVNESFFSDWTPSQISDFLTRSIFSPTNEEGQVNFYHSDIKEYLAAYWVERKMEKGNIKNLYPYLFGKDYNGTEFVFEVMKPIVAWLAVWNKKIRRKLIRIDPILLFEKSDTLQFFDKDRIKLFKKLVAHARKDERFAVNINYVSLRKLAQSSLEKPIQRALKCHKKQFGVYQFILRIIARGKMKNCAELALPFVLNKDSYDTTIMEAIRAVALTEKQDIKQQVVKHFIEKNPSKNPDIFMILLEEFFSEELSLKQFFALAKNVEKNEFSVDLTYNLSELIYKKCPLESRLCLLRGLVEILSLPPFAKDNMPHSISKKHSWLVEPLSQLIKLILGTDSSWNTNSPDILSVLAKAILMIFSAEYYGVVSIYRGVEQREIDSHPQLKRALYWEATQWGRKTNEDLWGAVYVDNESAIPTSQDINWLFEDIKGREQMQDKLGALESLFRLWVQGGEEISLSRKIQETIEPALELKQKYEKLYRELQESKEREKEEKPWERRHREIEENKNSNLEKAKAVLRKVIPELKAGEKEIALIWLRRKTREGAETKWSRTEESWDKLIPSLGGEIVAAAKEGLKNYWKLDSTIGKMKDKYPEKSSTSPYAVLALSGLFLESQNESWEKNLSKDLVKQAAKMALFELNGFPNWLDSLHKGYPKLVVDVFCDCLNNEVRLKNEASPLMHDLYYHASRELKRDISSHLFETLEEEVSMQNEDEVYAISIILQSEYLDRGKFSTLAQRRFNSAKNLIWLAALFYVDADKALEMLNAHLREMNGVEADRAVETLLNYLSSSSFFAENSIFESSGDKNYLKNRKVIFALTNLAYSHIRLSDDIDHSGEGSWTPGARDRAQDTRYFFLNKLTQFQGKETYEMLGKLANHQHIKNHKNHRNYILRSAEGRAHSDNDFLPLNVGEFNNLEEKITKKNLWQVIITYFKEHWIGIVISILIAIITALIAIL